ncbi:hypothetical protein CBS101457_006921 [Exobasidium rhododendri]|nr:hypothetical protein CBS101457_006921 [Exobasidium rhododendri]
MIRVAAFVLVQAAVLLLPKDSSTVQALSIPGLNASPTVTLDYGTFQGFSDVDTTSFLGLPFGTAKRFEPATLFSTKLSGVQDATTYGNICPQSELTSADYPGLGALSAFIDKFEDILVSGPIGRESEDCLKINVQFPKNTSADAKLPVALWIHGGAYQIGSGDAIGAETGAVPGVFYQGANLVKRSIELDQPMIYVSANHRLNTFGLLSGQELTEANGTNLLLRDQRLAMTWIQKYISNFGGDPTKVTIFGESAGSSAVSMHLLLNDGDNEGLFRGAMMFSGSPIRLSPQSRGQSQFDDAVSYCGCSAAADKLACLKVAPYACLHEWGQSQPNFISYNGMAFPFTPRPDGNILTASPYDLVSTGKIANVPIVIGDLKDEGTLFSLVNQLNVTTEQDFKDYFQTIWWPNATDAELDQLAVLYPSDPSAGSPFDTGDLNSISPQYKRIAAVTGDFWFQYGRRNLLDNAPNANKWTYQIEVDVPLLGQVPLLDSLGVANIPVVGSFHGADLFFYIFGNIPEVVSKNTLTIMSTIVSFVNTLDPNTPSLDYPTWPKYDSTAKQMFQIKEDGPAIITDDYRSEQMDFLASTVNFQL